VLYVLQTFAVCHICVFELITLWSFVRLAIKEALNCISSQCLPADNK